MIKIRRSKERGHANHGWLDTHYTFSFSDYYDPRYMGFRDLRVINEDFVEPAQGFPKHGHKDMEIITYMISGELSHRDSMGNGETIHSKVCNASTKWFCASGCNQRKNLEWKYSSTERRQSKQSAATGMDQ